MRLKRKSVTVEIKTNLSNKTVRELYLCFVTRTLRECVMPVQVFVNDVTYRQKKEKSGGKRRAS